MPAHLVATDDATGLHSSIRGLHATPTAPLPFLHGVAVRSFVLERQQGNILIYHSPGVTAAKREILALGRPERLLVNHWHEAMYDAPDLDVPIFVHADDLAQTRLPIAGTFAERGMIGADLELIPTPGHTAGSTAFLWDNGEQRMLFPGDSIWVQDGEWKAVLLGDSDRAAYLTSLATLMAVEFDVLVPWGGEDGQPYAYPVTRSEAQEKLGRIAARLRSGKNA